MIPSSHAYENIMILFFAHFLLLISLRIIINAMYIYWKLYLFTNRSAKERTCTLCIVESKDPRTTCINDVQYKCLCIVGALCTNDILYCTRLWHDGPPYLASSTLLFKIGLLIYFVVSPKPKWKLHSACSNFWVFQQDSYLVVSYVQAKMGNWLEA